MIATCNRNHDIAGNYSIQWDANNFSNGLYFYSINADGFTDAKKMVLVREG